jgi:hypothetical protein
MGGYWIKKGAIPIKEMPLSERRGMKRPAHLLPTTGRGRQGGVKRLFSQKYRQIPYMFYIRSKVYTSSGKLQCEF